MAIHRGTSCKLQILLGLFAIKKDYMEQHMIEKN